MTSRNWDAEHAEARASRRQQGTAPFPASVALSSLTEARLEDEETDELRRFLLRHGEPEPEPEPQPEPEPEQPVPKGHTCFDPAAAFFSPASILLATGADPATGQPIHTTGLIQAVGRGDEARARELLERGASPSLAASNGGTPLMHAAGRGLLPIVRLLLEFRADLNAARPATGWTAFHYACAQGQPECAAALVRAGCGMSRTVSGETGVELAGRRGHEAVVRTLREVIALELQPAALVDAEGGVCRLLEGFSNANARLIVPRRDNAQQKREMNLLEVAVSAKAEATVRQLLSVGADPNLLANSRNRTTPLHTAAAAGHLAILELLLDAKANVDAVTEATGSSAYHFACAEGHGECAAALEAAGCDTSLRAKDGRTGAQLAERRRLRKEMAEIHGG